MSSGDETNIRPLSESQQQILSRYATSDAVRNQSSAVSSLMHSRQGHHSLRARLELDLVQQARPATDDTTAGTDAVIVNEDQVVSSDLEERVRSWDFIGMSLPHVYRVLVMLPLSYSLMIYSASCLAECILMLTYL